MHALHIRRLHARYRLPASAVGERHRLDAILASALGEAIEAVLASEPLEPREEWCIRQLHVPVRLRLASTDLALATTWGQAVATAIRTARGIATGTGTVPVGESPVEFVRYRSREHALLEMARQVVVGDRRRIWAWKQLDLWRTSDAVTDSEAVREWVRALVREPGSIVSILRLLAQADQLGGLAGRLEAGHWISLAASALDHSGVGLSWKDLVHETRPGAVALFSAATSPGASGTETSPEPGRSRADAPREGGVSTPTETSRRHAARIVRESRIGRACAADPLVLGAERALAALMCLEVEPGWSSRSREQWLEFLDRIEDARRHGPPSSRAATKVQPVRPSSATAKHSSPPLEELTRPDAEDGSGGAETADRVGTPSSSKDCPNASSETGPDEEGEVRLTWVEEGRRRGITRVGGLLFLLNLLPAVGIPERWERDLPGRSTRWAMHRLGVRLVARAGLEPAVPEDDCGLLAFAGLTPEAEVPADDGETGDMGEVARWDALADEVVRALEARWPEKPPSTVHLLGDLCRRDAEILADPGWIEVRYSLNDVSTDLRRAGLDLDPGFIPWLGVVLRFVYE